MKINLDMSSHELQNFLASFRQTERELTSLRADYNSLATRYAELMREKYSLESEVSDLKYDLQCRESSIKALQNENARQKDELAMAMPDRKAFMRTMLAKLAELTSNHSSSYEGAHDAMGNEILRFARRGEKIQCIKIVRTFTGLDLRESKELVEEVLFPYKVAVG